MNKIEPRPNEKFSSKDDFLMITSEFDET